MNLHGISTFVAGADRGLGHASTTGLLALGVRHVYAAVRRPESLAAAFLGETRVIPRRLDATDLDSIAADPTRGPRKRASAYCLLRRN